MPRHEFGLMPQAPRAHERYDQYEPERYGCISVDDTLIEEIVPKLMAVDFYWHTVDRPAKGLAYCGVTLLPPESLGAVRGAIGDREAFRQFRELLQLAEAENKFVIHFGI